MTQWSLSISTWTGIYSGATYCMSLLESMLALIWEFSWPTCWKTIAMHLVVFNCSRIRWILLTPSKYDLEGVAAASYHSIVYRKIVVACCMLVHSRRPQFREWKQRFRDDEGLAHTSSSRSSLVVQLAAQYQFLNVSSPLEHFWTSRRYHVHVLIKTRLMG